MRFRKGSRVEVFSNKEAPYGAWRCAEIISGNGHTYNVRFFSFHEEAVMERVPRKVIRPCPPLVDVERWEAGELVEVLDSFAWKAATVRQELCGKYYVVRLLGTPAEFTFHKANIRVRQSWQDERWVAIGKISGSVKSSLLTGSDVQRKLQPQVNSIRLHEPSVVSARMLKRSSPHNWPECSESCTGNPKKIRSLEAFSKSRKTGCCQMVRVRSNGSSESVRPGSLVADDGYDSDACSVGSCSAGSDDESNMPPCMLDGYGQQADSCSSEAESFCGVGEEARRKRSLAGDGVRRSCRNIVALSEACRPFAFRGLTLMLGFTTSPFGHMNGVLELALSTGLESCGCFEQRCGLLRGKKSEMALNRVNDHLDNMLIPICSHYYASGARSLALLVAYALWKFSKSL
ncbi:hypothetical protein Bca101_022463 [Brassica carinata]